MSFENVKAEITLLLNEMGDHPDDASEAYVKLHEKLNEMRAMGLPVPADLAKLERQLHIECCAGSQGR